MTPTPEPGTIGITDARDGVDHRVDEADYAAGLARRPGRVRARCGRMLLPAALSTVPGRPCPACARSTAPTPIGAGRHRRFCRPTLR